MAANKIIRSAVTSVSRSLTFFVFIGDLFPALYPIRVRPPKPFVIGTSEQGNKHHHLLSRLAVAA
jgi:hypothetical protein